jgi:hypothetical protein
MRWLSVIKGCLLILVGVIVCHVAGVRVHFEPNLSFYRHWRVAQTKAFSDGATMTVDDMWTVRSGDLRFLRVLCHGASGFIPDKYWMKASLLQSANGPVIQDNYTWYVPMPKTASTPQGATPFFWEFRIPATLGDKFCVRISYQFQAQRLDAMVHGKINSLAEQRIDFNLPNVATERDMSVPDFFASNFYQ